MKNNIGFFGGEDILNSHLNKEKVIRYYLLFLPPKGCESILNIGSGVSDPYGGMLKTRTKKYRTLDLRKSNMIDYVMDVTNMKELKNNEFEWGWCIETLEHIPKDKKEIAVNEILRVCKHLIITYPSKDFKMFDKKGNIINDFYADPGHSEVTIDWNKYSNNYNIIDKSTKNGRKIFILENKKFDINRKVKKNIKGFFKK